MNSKIHLHTKINYFLIIKKISLSRYNKKTYRIDGIDWTLSPDSKFECGGNSKPYHTYYQVPPFIWIFYYGYRTNAVHSVLFQHGHYPGQVRKMENYKKKLTDLRRPFFMNSDMSFQSSFTDSNKVADIACIFTVAIILTLVLKQIKVKLWSLFFFVDFFYFLLKFANTNRV